MATYKPLTAENCKDFKNFNYSEFKCKCGGKYCNGYPVPFSYDLAKNLQTIRNHFGKPLVITSPLRDTAWNSKVGGANNSPHTRGLACDFYINGVSYNTLASYVKTLPYFRYCYRVNKNQDVIHYDIIPPNETNVIQPVQRDETKDQLKVLSTGLQVREYDTKTAKVLGQVATNGIYNFYETSDNEGYTWYRIGDKQWIANIKLEIYPKKGEEEDPEMIAELQKQIDELNAQNQELEELNSELENKNALLSKNNAELEAKIQELNKYTTKEKFTYKCLKNGSHKVYLKKGELLVIKEE